MSFDIERIKEGNSSELDFLALCENNEKEDHIGHLLSCNHLIAYNHFLKDFMLWLIEERRIMLDILKLNRK